MVADDLRMRGAECREQAARSTGAEHQLYMNMAAAGDRVASEFEVLDRAHPSRDPK
jgi:hypothetical protein